VQDVEAAVKAGLAYDVRQQKKDWVLVSIVSKGGGPLGRGSGMEEGCMFMEIRVEEVVHSGSGAVSEKDDLHL
jgi:hypothetical protein